MWMMIKQCVVYTRLNNGKKMVNERMYANNMNKVNYIDNKRNMCTTSRNSPSLLMLFVNDKRYLTKTPDMTSKRLVLT